MLRGLPAALQVCGIPRSRGRVMPGHAPLADEGVNARLEITPAGAAEGNCARTPVHDVHCGASRHRAKKSRRCYSDSLYGASDIGHVAARTGFRKRRAAAASRRADSGAAGLANYSALCKQIPGQFKVTADPKRGVHAGLDSPIGANEVTDAPDAETQRPVATVSTDYAFVRVG